MSKENPSILKIELRKKFTLLRQAISTERRRAAAKAARGRIQQKGCILSFYSFGSEIDLSLLNCQLLSEKRLALPRIENNELVAYQISDLDSSLQKAPWGGLEPNPHLSLKIPISQITLVLVPGLAFDIERFRLGYGKGHYDQFLKAAENIETLGIGFKEQLIDGLLPRDSWDIPLKNCCFF